MSESPSLDELALKHGTDKSSRFHNYTTLYEQYFRSFRMKKITFMEIGVDKGASIRMWADYFPNATIIGVDNDPNCWKGGYPRCSIVMGDQEDSNFLNELARSLGPFDIIVDDGGHTMKGQQVSIETLFPCLRDDGFYIIEALHSSYMHRFTSSSYPSTFKFLEARVQDLQLNEKKVNENTIYADKVNHLKTLPPETVLNMWEENLQFIHYYRSVVFLNKKCISLRAASSVNHHEVTLDIRDRYLEFFGKSLLDYYYIPISVQTNAKVTESDLHNGNSWPDRAVSMIGVNGMMNVKWCVEKIIQDDIKGDLLEAGVWKGGACIFMRAILRAHNQNSRKIFICDSFEGLPPPDEKYAADIGDMHHTKKFLAVDMPTVQNYFERFGMEDENNIFVKGWFKDTLPGLVQKTKDGGGFKELSLLRLDGDMYGSTIETLSAVYDSVVPGGFIIVDDYGMAGCRQAVNEFRTSRSITDPIIFISDSKKMFWRKHQGKV